MNSNEIENLLAQYRLAIIRGIGSGQTKNIAGLEQAAKYEATIKAKLIEALAK